MLDVHWWQSLNTQSASCCLWSLSVNTMFRIPFLLSADFYWSVVLSNKNKVRRGLVCECIIYYLSARLTHVFSFHSREVKIWWAEVAGMWDSSQQCVLKGGVDMIYWLLDCAVPQIDKQRAVAGVARAQVTRPRCPLASIHPPWKGQLPLYYMSCLVRSFSMVKQLPHSIFVLYLKSCFLHRMLR